MDLSRSRLTRLEGEVVFEVGALQDQGPSAVFWFDRDHFMPRGWIQRLLNADGTWIVHRHVLKDYDPHRPVLPGVMLHWKDEQLIMGLKVESVRVNQQLPETLFQLDLGDDI